MNNILKTIPLKNKRLLRGGSWHDRPGWVRSATRNEVRPTARDNDVGFRFAGPKTEPKSRALHGGSWNFGPWWARSAIRLRYWPTSRDGYVGFRIAGPKTEKKEFEITRNAK